MNSGFKLFLFALQFGGLAPSKCLVKNGENQRLPLKRFHFIYPVFVLVISWFCAFRYFVYLAFLNSTSQYTAPEVLLYICAIGYYLMTALFRTNFLLTYWRKWEDSPLKLYERCHLDDELGKHLKHQLKGYENGQTDQTDNLLWKWATFSGLCAFLSNFAFMLTLTIIQKYNYGTGSNIAISHVLLQKNKDKEWPFIVAAFLGTTLNTFNDTTHFGLALSAALTFNVALRFRELRNWLKQNRINGKSINLKATQELYCHLVDMIKEVDDKTVFGNGIIVAYAYLGILSSVYQLLYGEKFVIATLSRFTFAFWMTTFMLMMLTVIVPSVYANKMAKKAKLELVKFKLSKFIDEKNDWNNANLQHFFASTKNDEISLTFFRLVHLNSTSLLAVSFYFNLF